MKPAPRFVPWVVGLMIISLSPSESKAATNNDCQTWDYALDTWRIVPKSLAVSNATVQVSWHIADIYIPGTPGAANEPFDGAVSVQLDNNPRVYNTIFARAQDSEKPRATKLTGLKPGPHRLTVALSVSGGAMSEFTTCFSVPTQKPIKHWRDIPGEASQSP